MEGGSGMSGLIFDTSVPLKDRIDPKLPVRKRQSGTAFGTGHIVLCYMNVGRPEAILEFCGSHISASMIDDADKISYVNVNEDVYRSNGIRGICTAIGSFGWGHPTYLMVDPLLHEFTRNMNPKFLWQTPVANALCTSLQPDNSYAPDYADIMLNPV